ncbi:MAG: aminotransferase class V-fold PLP-dependent enzyme [Clostridia bacterium]|nr:aminotransferase class V-fold PLP-dependent enzyme [Clostridia bacterium]
MKPFVPVYLDNAATTFPKPPAVLSEVNDCIRRYCGNPGRGSHPMAMAAAEQIFSCRCALSDFVGGYAPEHVIFTQNTTYAINLFLKGILKKGDHVLISDLEHNAVFRPIWKMAQDGVIEYDVFPSMCGLASASPVRICAGIAKRLRPNTRLVICTHASNLCSHEMPLSQIGAFCHRHGLLFAVDAAQSAGHLPINMKAMQIDALALPGHKGLYGIQGAGALILAPSVSLSTLVEGGNGLHSLEGDMPDQSPERYESGTPPTPSIAGLLRGVEAVRAIGLDAIADHEARLFERMHERLSSLSGVTVYAPDTPGAVLLFSADGIPSEQLAAELGRRGICVRGGYHCSALGHATLHTPPDGAVRASFGIFNTETDVDRLCDALAELIP